MHVLHTSGHLEVIGYIVRVRLCNIALEFGSVILEGRMPYGWRGEGEKAEADMQGRVKGCTHGNEGTRIDRLCSEGWNDDMNGQWRWITEEST
jgi:hypothetical protein